MAIRKDQRRVTIIMNQNDYDKVVVAAKTDRRSVSSYCNNVIMCTIDKNDRPKSSYKARMVEKASRKYKIVKHPRKTDVIEM